ncbi:asparaginase [Virgibacillus sp. MSJ-26]|uniref:asparaginase n=1 Tax=Virgibacillus sp. MSJ-26 TaxID=2841522 RepID=UPI001C0F5A54|nr:asparaginase [Virgibacillus sp. MSJ-26]MBU5467282.1 asparaginase [Virgibacillus sp. MSJ-26]
MKKIIIIHLGGTISAQGKNRLDLKDYQSGKVSGDEFFSSLPEIQSLADIKMYELDGVSSTNINIKHWMKLKRLIETYLNENQYDGVVITHGTSTLEETAYFLHLKINCKKPIVLVGAQRPFSALSSDAPLNLIQAVKVAVHEASENKGVLIVSNDRIYSARDVTKTDTYRLDTFQSTDLGCLGYIETDDTVQYYREPLRRHTIHSELTDVSLNKVPLIEIVYSYAGATGTVIDMVTQSKNYQGIILAGTGAGRFSNLEEEALSRAIDEGLFIVRSSRGGNGRVVDIDAFSHLNLITGDNLTPQKARILLMLALLKYDSLKDIQKAFDEY